MKELLLVGVLAAIIVSGYFIIKKYDLFLTYSRRRIEKETAENVSL